MTTLQHAESLALSRLAVGAGCLNRCRVRPAKWPALRGQLRAQGASWLAVLLTGAGGSPAGWLVYSDVRCPAGAPWASLGPGEAGRTAALWLHLRRPEEIDHNLGGDR